MPPASKKASSKRNFDVVIAGGSAVGCLLASLLSKVGVSVAVLEEDPFPGKDGKCTALVSRKGLDLIASSTGLDYAPAVLGAIDGADFFCGKAKISVSRKSVALVLDRRNFDFICFECAKKSGASFFFSHAFSSASEGPGGAISVLAKSGSGKGKKLAEFSCRVLVGADGFPSSVARDQDFPDIPLSKTVLGFQSIFSIASHEKRAHVFFSPEFSGFFGWAVPFSSAGIHGCKAGFCTRDFPSAEKGREKILSLAPLYSPSEESDSFWDMIPLCVRPEIQRGNILLAGDSAGQVKATTGGGLVFGFLSAKIASEEIASFLSGGSLNYERRFRAELGPALRVHSLFRSFLNILPFPVFSALFLLASTLKTGPAINYFGDMDFVFRGAEGGISNGRK